MFLVMPKCKVFYCALALLLLSKSMLYAKGESVRLNDSFSIAKIAVDLPFLSISNKPILPIKYECNTTKKYLLNGHCYTFLENGDSVLVFSFFKKPMLFYEGIHAFNLTLSFISDANNFFAPSFVKVMHTIKTMPCGKYKFYLKMITDSTTIYPYMYSITVDSNLTPTSVLKKDINTLFQNNLHFNENDSINLSSPTIHYQKPSVQLKRLYTKIEFSFSKKGFTTRSSFVDGIHYINIYLNQYFIGRYVLYESNSISQQLKATQQRVNTQIASFASPDVLNSNSLITQVKSLLQSKDEHNDLLGNFSLSSNLSNAQPDYAMVDQNFHEFRADLTTKVLNIPLSVEGFYTTQDAHRKIKSSFFRVHYDVNKLKTDLLSKIESFKNQFNEYSAQGQNMAMQYGSLLQGFEVQQQAILTSLQREAGLNRSDFSRLPSKLLQNDIDTAFIAQWVDTLIKQASVSAALFGDSTSKYKVLQSKTKVFSDSIRRVYQTSLIRYQQLLRLEAKIKSYSNLLQQYQNTHYFDSVLGYAKLKEFSKLKDMNAKELSNSAASFLPDGQAKKVITGLNNFDLGVFSNYISKYTMAGQQVRGIDVGYNINTATTVGITLGKTQYIGRDGAVNDYASYAFRTAFKFAEQHRLQLIYYGYSPSLSIFANDSFRKHIDITLPSFKDPQAILASTYEGRLFNKLQINAELATSRLQHQDFKTQLDATKLAWNVHLEGAIPATKILLNSAYEHIGVAFNNATLPVSNNGIDKYSLGLKSTFFHSFLSLGIAFNHLQQDRFGIRGGNNRWGFDLGTHSKRYPSILLSYKPYTTFRSFADTFAIPQQAILGAVWNGKLSYQLKNKSGGVWRFMATYTHSASIADTLRYAHEVKQLSILYSNKIWFSNLSIGASSSLVDGTTPVTQQQATRFVMVVTESQMSKFLRMGMGLDVGYALFGLSRYGMTAQLSYSFKNIPFSIRMQARNANYHLTAEAPWKNLWSGGVDIIWKLKMKIS